MLSLFTRRVTLSAYRSGATRSRILPPTSTLRDRIPYSSHHTGTVRTFTNPQRNASTKATVTVSKAKSSAKSITTGRTKPGKKLTPEQKATQKQKLQAEKDKKKKKEEIAAALRAKKKAQAEKEKEAAALKRKRLAERNKKLAEARAEKKTLARAKAEKEKERQKAREAKKPKIIKPPPRRMSAYALFVQEVRKPVQEATVGWRNLSEEAKQEYTARAQVVQGKRKEEFDAFSKTVTRVDILRYNRLQKSKGGNRVNFKASDRPRRPLSPFMRFMQEFRKRPDQAGKPPIEISKAAGEVWRSFTQEEKDRYKPKPTESTTV